MIQLCISIKSFELYYIKNGIKIIKKMQFLVNKKTGNKLPLLNDKIISLPKKRKLFTVLTSPHIDKKSREQFEFISYKKKIFISTKNLNQAVLLIFLLKNTEFPGVEIEISLIHTSLFCNTLND